jgi:hypothetical protein
MHQHEKAEEDLSLVVVGSPAYIHACSFLLGLMMAFFDASSVSTLAIFGCDAEPNIFTLFYILGTCFTSVIISIGFYRVFDRLVLYPVSGDPPKGSTHYHPGHQMLFCSRNAARRLLGLGSRGDLIWNGWVYQV